MSYNTVRSLIHSIDFDIAWEDYNSKYHYNESERYRAKYFYEKIIKRPLNMTITPPECTLTIEKVSNEIENYLHISGKYHDDDEIYSISYEDWDNVLAFDYDLNGFSEAEFIFTLINDISFHGDESDMIAFRNKIEYRIKNYNSYDALKGKEIFKEVIKRLKSQEKNEE